jgi:hypothetical protein
MPRLAPPVQLAVTAAAALAAFALAGCGPIRADNSHTVNAYLLDRSPLVTGAGSDLAPGIRALPVSQPRTVSDLLSDFHKESISAPTGSFQPYVNGLRPTVTPGSHGSTVAGNAYAILTLGGQELVYGGDSIGFIEHDQAKQAGPAPSAVVGMYPAPFTSRYTKKREKFPVRLQCADGNSAPCHDVANTIAALKVPTGISNLLDASQTSAIRVFVGPYSQLSAALDTGLLAKANPLDQSAITNGIGFEMTPDGSHLVAPDYGGAAPGYGPGTGFIVAFRDLTGVPIWVISGTDAVGTQRAADTLNQLKLSGRVSAIIPPPHDQP